MNPRPAAACRIPDALVRPVDEHPPPRGRHRPPPLGLPRLHAHRTGDTVTAPRPPHP
ncbi:hypothetical protein [Streptomyces diastatochromogenes]|uniref:hypothetical protein n=1 Tax=Streptomyces diastatochromogenes TaxID=42236 RepID=UPI002F26DC21